MHALGFYQEITFLAVHLLWKGHLAGWTDVKYSITEGGHHPNKKEPVDLKESGYLEPKTLFFAGSQGCTCCSVPHFCMGTTHYLYCMKKKNIQSSG